MAHEGISSAVSIYSLHNCCLNSISTLLSLFAKGGFEKYETRLWEEVGRFKVWAESTAAHRRNRMSLDYRLHEASKIKEMVLELLEGLDTDLKDGKLIVNRPFPMLTVSGTAIDIVSAAGESHFDDAPDELAQDTPHVAEPYGQDPEESRTKLRSGNPELDECFVDIADVITCLYEFAVTIRNPAPRDRLEKCRDIDVSHYEFYDLQHVENKFRGAEKYLTDRLGRANTRRRQLLEYYRIHHEKIAGRYPGVPIEEASTILKLQQDRNIQNDGNIFGISRQDEEKEIWHEPRGSMSSPPTIALTTKTQTTVSIITQRETQTSDAYSDTDQSQTSYASTASGDEKILRVPPPPDQESAYDGKPFLCAYCHQIIQVTGWHSWMYVIKFSSFV